jgi:hypothetical protein
MHTLHLHAAIIDLSVPAGNATPRVIHEVHWRNALSHCTSGLRSMNPRLAVNVP